MANCTVCGRKAQSDYCFQHKPRTPIATKLHCTRCDATDHLKVNCPERTTDRINPATGRYPTVKRLRTVGKFGMMWRRTRRLWIENHPGPWECYLCGCPLTTADMTLDHVKSRSRHPELRFEMNNLKPCCWACNTAKGSRDLQEI
jgi:5-methylcytosine-specific restriction endonuclease McrA